MKYKERKTVDKKRAFAILALILLSLAVGFCVAAYGKDKSFLEDKSALFSVIITLFGLGVTSTIFVSQTLDDARFNQEKTDKVNKLKASLSKSLALMAILILAGVVLEFVASLFTTNKYNIATIIEALMYSSLVYCIALEADITGCFLNIMKLKQDREEE